MRAEFRTAGELGEHLLALAQRVHDPVLLTEAHKALGASLAFRGEMIGGRAHLEQAVAIPQVQPPPSLALFYADPRVDSLAHLARVLWVLGYPEQARQRSQEALTRARELNHPGSLAMALDFAGWVYQMRREEPMLREQAEALVRFSTEHELRLHGVWGTVLRGEVLAAQGQITEGMAQMREGWLALRDSGTKLNWSYILGLLAEAYGKAGQTEEGFAHLREAFAVLDESGGRWWEAELYRLKGELTLQTSVQSLATSFQKEAEACFHKAIDIARKQQAKSLELRAVMSLGRLWQQQGKKEEAHRMLVEVYGWFTEGFDTADLKDAEALLGQLA
jgi:predicted ATPase